MTVRLPAACMLVSCLVLAAVVSAPAQSAAARSPIIYSTDLYYTFIMDNDDPFDAAVLLKCPELNVKGVILDNHTFPSDGEKVLEKIMELSGHRVPYVKGLGEFAMRSFDDSGLDAADQGGVDMILKTLRESKEKVTLIGVGSMTDFAIAYVREPQLFHEKVAKIYVVAGTMESRAQDWNVALDPIAFVKLMRSDLPIVWVPVDTSMWYFPAPQMLVPEKNRLAHFLLNESLYYYLYLDAKNGLHKDRYEYYDLGLRLWSTPAFVLAANDPHASEMFDTAPAKVEFDDTGLINSVKFVPESNILVVKRVNGAKLNQFIVTQIDR